MNCIHHIFTAQAKIKPEAVTLVDHGRQYTYAEIDRVTNQIARVLQEKGVGPEVIIGCYFSPSVENIIAILSILKAGGAYLLLDPLLPDARLTYMIKDADIKFIITDKKLPKKLSKLRPVIDIKEAKNIAYEQKNIPPHSNVSEDNLAYIAYTSGSTGRPKGVLITHKSIVNLAENFIKTFGLRVDDFVPLMAPLAFDVAIEEMIPPLISDAILIIAKQKYVSMQDFNQEIINNHYTILNIPAPLWHRWVHYLHDAGLSIPSSLRLVIVGSEKIYTSVFQVWKNLPRANKVQWVAAYGTTETTVTSTYYLTALQDDLKNEVIMPIGKPIDNTTLYIINERGELIKNDNEGELCIGGIGVARGYHNLSDKTSESFVLDNFSTISNGRIYKTGDLARFLPDGNVMLLGRKDDQIKINGLRIELSEIESIICEFSQIKEAVVIFQPAKNIHEQGKLIAYFESRNKKKINIKELKDFLDTHLHRYMLPENLIQINKIPLTSNGKIDRKKLEHIHMND